MTSEQKLPIDEEAEARGVYFESIDLGVARTDERIKGQFYDVHVVSVKDSDGVDHAEVNLDFRFTANDFNPAISMRSGDTINTRGFKEIYLTNVARSGLTAVVAFATQPGAFDFKSLRRDYSTARDIKKLAYSGTDIEYMGFAKPGTAASDAGWRIQKNTYSSGNLTDTLEANSTTNYDKVWDDRATYTYG